MMSLRAYARSAPRVLNQIGTKSIRSQGFLRSSPILSSAWKQAATPRALASFHTTASRKDTITAELVGVLSKELDFEEPNISKTETENYSNNTKEYLENSEYKLVDNAGQDEVTLTRTFNDEIITVKFNILDLIEDTEADEYENQAMYDEEDADASDIMAGQSGGGNTKGSVNQGRTKDGNFKVAPEDHIAPADRTELEEQDFEDDEPPVSFPARVSIKIEKANKGAVAIDAVVQDGTFAIDNVSYYSDAAVTDASTPEKDLQKRSLYAGPRFTTLDPELQAKYDTYLEERGISPRMALFIPDYIDFKENREYVGWLKNQKNFWSDE